MIKRINTINEERSEALNALYKSCKVFWAFSNSQFEQNRTELKEGEKYIDIGHGGYMPKGDVDTLLRGSEDIEKTFKQAIIDNKQRDAHILYELNNYEAFLTTELGPTLDALGDEYTLEEVTEVYKRCKALKYAVRNIAVNTVK